MTSPILDASDLICQRRRLAMAMDPTTGLTGVVEAMHAVQGVLWARVGNERLAAWVPAKRLVVERQRPTGPRLATPPPPRPDSEPPRVPRLRALTTIERELSFGPTTMTAEIPTTEENECETVRP